MLAHLVTPTLFFAGLIMCMLWRRKSSKADALPALLQARFWMSFSLSYRAQRRAHSPPPSRRADAPATSKSTMKALLFGKTLVIVTSKGLSRAQSRGLATLEILIAFAVLSLTLTAMVAVAFSNQSISVDTQNNSEALALARAQLEDARAAAKADFFSLLPSAGTHPSGPLTYGTSVVYSDIAPFAKQATSTITWTTGGRSLSLVLSTILTDPLGALSGDTCNPTLAGDWTTPAGPQNGSNPGYGYYDYPSPDGTSGIDAAGGRAYVTTDPSSASKPDFYIIGVNNPNPPGSVLPLLGMFNTTYGLTDVRVSGKYAYTAAD